jgi:Lrp/AsnC family transcriptional regulator, leucine-responsive regulatory protein
MMHINGRIDYESLEQNIKLDVKDKRILSLLSEDSRMPLTQIAKKVKLSRDAVNYRINRMTKEEIILKFCPNLNYEKLGFFLFHVFLLIEETDKDAEKNLIKHLCDHPNIISVVEYSDRWDYEIIFISRNLIEFDTILSDIVSKFPDIIQEKDKLEIIRVYNSSFVPPLIREKGHEHEKIHVKPILPAKIDQIDIQLLRLLTEDARMSTYDIGKKLKLSPDAVSYRIKKLKDEEVIKNFTILVNLSRMKYHWYTFSVGMKMFDMKNEEKFKAFLDQNLNIMRSAKTLGGWDLLLYLIVENPREFHAIVKQIKNTFADIIRNYQTWMTFKEYIYKPMPDAIKLEKEPKEKEK